MNDQASNNILLAEDNIFNQKVTLAMLKKLGFQADVAKNGQEVLDKMEQNNYAIIFMDCEMPVMDGFVATEKIREMEKTKGQPTMPIVAMTAHSSLEDRQRCEQSGMNDYIAKPFKIDALQEVLSHWKLL